MPQVNLEVKEIYKKLCPKCKAVVESIVKDQLVDELLGPTVKQALEGKGEKT